MISKIRFVIENLLLYRKLEVIRDKHCVENKTVLVALPPWGQAFLSYLFKSLDDGNTTFVIKNPLYCKLIKSGDDKYLSSLKIYRYNRKKKYDLVFADKYGTYSFNSVKTILVDYNWFQECNEDEKCFHMSYYKAKYEDVSILKPSYHGSTVCFIGSYGLVYDGLESIFNCLTRNAIIKAIAKMQDEKEQNGQFLFHVNDGINTKKLSFVEYNNMLDRSDFFVCAPGMTMPQSHNLYETMEKGIIPIIQYNEWMYPPLVDGVDCIAFKDENTFKDALFKAQNMSKDDVMDMKKNVLEYYKKFCSPASLKSKIDNASNEATMLVNIEQRTVRRLVEQESSL